MTLWPKTLSSTLLLARMSLKDLSIRTTTIYSSVFLFALLRDRGGMGRGRAKGDRAREREREKIEEREREIERKNEVGRERGRRETERQRDRVEDCGSRAEKLVYVRFYCEQGS